MTFKILIADKLAAAGVEAFEAAEGFDVDNTPGLGADEQKKIIGQYHGMVVRSATQVTPDLLAAAENLKIVIRAGVGVDNIDIPACTEKGVLVENTPFGNGLSAAEHAIALLYSLARHIPQASASMHAGKWQKELFVGTQLTGKTLGVIGTGNVGRLAIERGKGIGMNVIAFDPMLTDEVAQELGVKRCSLEDLLAESDAITLHVPLLPGTKNLLSDAQFEIAKEGLLLVDAARGGVVDEDALCRALDSGKVRGAAMDVFAIEPLQEDSPLRGRDNVILTPHLGASTKDAQLMVATDAAAQMIAYLKDGEKKFALNAV